MAIIRFIPEVWSAELLVQLRKALVYGNPMIVNRDYEGEIRQAGDTVRITSISDPTVQSYTPNSTSITPEELTDAQRTLVVDQAKYFAFYVDDVDARQAKGNVIPEAMSRAAYKIADGIDQYIASLYTGAAADNQISSVSIDTTPASGWAAEAAKAYDDIIVPLGVALDEANVPSEGRYLVIPPWLHGVLLRDPRFITADQSGTTEGLRNGQVARAGGFTIFKSNNVPSPTAGTWVVQAGVSSAITFAEQISRTEAYRPESKFADAVKGLVLYGAKLVRPDCIATCSVSAS